MAKAKGDETGARELQLYADNTFELYGQKQSIEANLERKVKRGTYDSKQAPKLWKYWMDSAAKLYHRDHGSGGSWSAMFDVPTRELAAQSASDDWENENLAELKRKYYAENLGKKKPGTKRDSKRLPKYGEVARERAGGATIVVRGIFQQNKGDSYHVRVLRGEGRQEDERKRGSVLWKDDFYFEGGKPKLLVLEAKRAAREWVRGPDGKKALAKKKATKKKATKKKATKKKKKTSKKKAKKRTGDRRATGAQQSAITAALKGI